MPALVDEWRKAWSATPKTTDPLAPFGIVSLSQGDSEGNKGMGSFRWSQSANLGSLPNELIPARAAAKVFESVS